MNGGPFKGTSEFLNRSAWGIGGWEEEIKKPFADHPTDRLLPFMVGKESREELDLDIRRITIRTRKMDEDGPFVCLVV